MSDHDAEHTREILRKVRQIEIRSNRLVAELFAGSYQSAFKGQGIDLKKLESINQGMRFAPSIGMLQQERDFLSSNNTRKSGNLRSF